MRNPEDRSPQEWAEEARERIEDTDPDMHYRVWMLSAADCDELADRMDDLAEALRLLRSRILLDDGQALALLAKYEEGE